MSEQSKFHGYALDTETELLTAIFKARHDMEVAVLEFDFSDQQDLTADEERGRQAARLEQLEFQLAEYSLFEADLVTLDGTADDPDY
jgi:hypothetical protein